MGKRPAGEAPHLPKIIFAYSLASAACFPFPFSRRDQYRCGRSAHSSGVIPSRDTTNGAYFKHFLISDGKKKFEKLNIQIRDPQALESLSEIDMICFDKTGVLTTRNMEVKRVYYGDRVEDLDPPQNADIPSELILMGCALCNEVLFLEKMDLANPIDKALIAFAQKTGIGLQKLHDQYKRVYDQPFDSENRSMACGFERGDHEIYFFMKGGSGGDCQQMHPLSDLDRCDATRGF